MYQIFHAMATVSFRRNSITQIKDSNGNFVLDHDGKAALLHATYKNRMGISLQPTMQFDLSRLILPSSLLEYLTAPFLHEEIDQIVKLMPPDKAPGPYGFNGLFMKKCWNMIKENFYKLCHEFFEGTVNLESINSSFITLIPKVNNP